MNEKIYLICYETVNEKGNIDISVKSENLTEADFLELVKTAVNERVKEKFIITNIINLTKIRKELEE
ncbi:hypothetical protein [Leptotrichia trevisanii]|jgi:hypothetical protein|uniref:hypothetical protein n=1 Tax=Leptotrichia trevisanii TaxID=109328 RepID=UPI002070D604|nr:hypothetical protein [Leptotrichia trevisanii]DAP36061.1 MAG TPA: Spheroplast protein Y, Colicin-E7 immunity [Caudoviricetes sp.]